MCQLSLRVDAEGEDGAREPRFYSERLAVDILTCLLGRVTILLPLWHIVTWFTDSYVAGMSEPSTLDRRYNHKVYLARISFILQSVNASVKLANIYPLALLLLTLYYSICFSLPLLNYGLVALIALLCSSTN